MVQALFWIALIATIAVCCWGAAQIVNRTTGTD